MQFLPHRDTELSEIHSAVRPKNGKISLIAIPMIHATSNRKFRNVLRDQWNLFLKQASSKYAELKHREQTRQAK